MNETPEERRRAMRVLVPANVKAITNPEAEAAVNDALDTALVEGLIAGLYERVKELRAERDALLDFLIASGYPFDWNEAPWPDYSGEFPRSLRGSIARRWAEKENGEEGSYMETCAAEAGWTE